MMVRPGEEGVVLAVLAGGAAIAGHVASPYLLFRGGKGVATTIGVFAVLLRQWLLLPLAVWVAAARLTGYVSVGSMLFAASLPVASYLAWRGKDGAVWVLGLSAVVAVVIIYRHRSNMRRLVAGTEHRYGEQLKEAKSSDAGTSD